MAMGLIEDLRELTRLNDEGALSDAEFAEAKRQLIQGGDAAPEHIPVPDLETPVQLDQRVAQLQQFFEAAGARAQKHWLATHLPSLAQSLASTEPVLDALIVSRRMEQRLLVATNRRLLLTAYSLGGSIEEFHWADCTSAEVGEGLLPKIDLTLAAQRIKATVYVGDAARFATAVRHLAPQLATPASPSPIPLPVSTISEPSVGPRVDEVLNSESRWSGKPPADGVEAGRTTSPLAGLVVLAVLVVGVLILFNLGTSDEQGSLFEKLNRDPDTLMQQRPDGTWVPVDK